MNRFLILLLCLLEFIAADAGLAQSQEQMAGMSKSSIRAGTAYIGLIRDASDAFLRRDFPAAVKKLDEADEIKPGLYDSICLRASIFAEERDFEKAGELYEKALKIQPNSFLPKFNLAEMLLMQKKFAEAQASFEQLAGPGRQKELVDFKIVLAELGMGDDAKAREILDHMKFPGDTAAYYFASAGWEFAHGNKEKANELIRSADSIFGRSRNYPFYDSLADMDWVPVRRAVPAGAK